jgi:hypothetical protein
MPTQVSTIETKVRQRLNEPVANFWSSAEILGILDDGIKDLWRSITDLKQEHYLVVNDTDVTFEANTDRLTGVPTNIHKIYLIEARDLTTNGSNVGLKFDPLDYNHKNFQLARSRGAIDPANDTIYYSISGAGGPVEAPIIRCAPKVTSRVKITFSYIPTLTSIATGTDFIPIPGEADAALIAWTVAFARAKETDGRIPDSGWLAVYATEKQALLQSLGLREYQEPHYVDAVFQEYW